jgi:antitoxin component YwqK of YwqJK toxin-antitoxin module
MTISLFSCSQESNEMASSPSLSPVSSGVILKDSVKLIPTKGLVYYHGKPFTGTSVLFADTVKIESIDYINGKRNGFYRKWYPSGMLSFESEYKIGKQDGTAKTWWKNGQLRSESHFEKSVGNGVQLQWYKSGAKFKRMNLVNGREEGLQQSWRENGKLYNNYEAKNGRVFGLKRANLCYELEDEKVQYKDK